jgi:hypothetical protein
MTKKIWKKVRKSQELRKEGDARTKEREDKKERMEETKKSAASCALANAKNSK